MKTAISSVSLIVSLVCAASNPSIGVANASPPGAVAATASAGGDDAAARNRQERAVRDTMRAYQDAFHEFDVEATLAFYGLPGALLIPGGLLPITSADVVRAALNQSITRLQAAGYAYTETELMRVRLIGPDSAVAALVVSRFTDEDVLIERVGYVYHLAKKDGQWKIVVVAPASPDNLK